MRTRFLVVACLTSLAGLLPVSMAGAVTSAPPGRPSVLKGAVLSAIACPTHAHCLGVGTDKDGDGVAAVISSSKAKAVLGSNDNPNFGLESVACPNSSACLATATGSVVSVSVAAASLGTSTKIPQPKGGIGIVDNIACAGHKVCYAVGSDRTTGSSVAIIVRLSPNDAILRTTKIKTATGIGAIACPISTLCLLSVAHGGSGIDIQQLKKGKLGAKHALSPSLYVQDIACHGTSVCYALAGARSGSQTNELISLNPKTGAIGKEISLGSLSATGISCPSAKNCVVVGILGQGSTASGGFVIVTKGKAGKVSSLAGIPSGVACATSTVCLAVAFRAGGNTAVDRLLL